MEEIEEALSMVLGHGGQRAERERVSDFKEYAASRGLDLSKMVVVAPGEKVVWAVLPVPSPGKTLLLLTPSFAAPGPPELGPGALKLALAQFELGYLPQALVEPNEPGLLVPFVEAGFVRLAKLLYLQRTLTTSPPAPPVPAGMRVIHYSKQNHEVFKQAIATSYIDTLDCPALTGVRDMEDIIEGHKSSGAFHPSLWTLLVGQDSAATAVLLLSPAANGETMELVYLGVCPGFRNRGLGRWALRHALAETGRLSLPRLTLAVDEINMPAIRLYYSMGLQNLHARLALVRLPENSSRA